jgi:glyoxylase I family protein
MVLDFSGLCPLLSVFDMPTSLRFYRDLLEFNVISTSPAHGSSDDVGWVWLSGHGCELMLNTAYDEGERPESPDATDIRAHRDVGFYFSCPDVEAACVALRARGINVKEPQTTSYGMRQLSFNDPDGYGICFQHPA